MAKDAKFEARREVRTFVDIARVADAMISKTESEPKGSYYTTMSSLIFRAFTFEAYLNHFGDMKIRFWDEIESIKVMEKYKVLCKELEINPDFSRRPHQTLKQLFKFRNALAHGKSQVLEVEKSVSSGDDPHTHSPETHWEEFCTLDNAKRAKEDLNLILSELHKKAGLGNHPFIQGMTVSSISTSSPNK